MAGLRARVLSADGLIPQDAEPGAQAWPGALAGSRGWLNAAVGGGRPRRLAVAIALSATDALAALTAAAGVQLVFGAAPFEGVAGPFHHLVTPALACTIYGVFGLYGGYGPSPAERLRLRSWGSLAFAVACALVLAGSGVLASRIAGIAATALLLVPFGFYGEVAIRRFLIRRRMWGAPTAIVGLEGEGPALASALLAQPELGLRPVGFIGRPGEGAGSPDTGRLPILGTLETAGLLKGRIEVAIFCSSAEFAANDLANPGALPFSRVVVAHDAQALQCLWLQTRPLGGVLGLEIRRDLYRRRNLRLKRAVDILLAWPATLLAAPLIGLLALAIKWVDPGPAFYVQSRVGRNGKPIRVLKLRSMYIDAEPRLMAHLAADPQAREEWGLFFKLTHDPRILPGIGNFIRRSSLDELPQLWNVARGDMSLIGPRPFPSYHLDSFDPDFQKLRASVWPGLSGLWQVSSRSDGDLETQKSQDSFYIRNWSIWLDLYILLATVPAVLGGSGAR